MENKLRFVVMGDMHYVNPDCHKRALGGNPSGVTEVVDLTRNYWMTQNVLPSIFADITAAKPDFIIQTGDFVHGHGDDESAVLRELSEGIEVFKHTDIPVFIAKGTHDGVTGTHEGAVSKEVLEPFISRALGEHLDRGYYHFIKDNSLFVVLDYTGFSKGDEQTSYIQEILSQSGQYDHVFVFAHPPLVPVGRPFFTNYDFVNKVKEAIEQYPIDGYFCGHTHNQVASIHKIGENWIPQLKSSILGYPDEDPIKLEDVRPLLPDPSVFDYGWGFLEDSAPGWWLVTVEGSKVTAQWHVLNNGVQGELVWDKGEKPGFTRLPSFDSGKEKERLGESKILSARIRIAGSNCKTTESYKLYLNEQFIADIPRLEYFDCRQFIQLEPSLWGLLKKSNSVSLTTADEPFCIGAAVIEVETESGWIRSSVSPYYTNSTRWDLWEYDGLKHIPSGSDIQFDLNFD